jgi:hypothetical protein
MEDSSQMAVVHLHILTPTKQGPYSLEELAQLADVPPALAQLYFENWRNWPTCPLPLPSSISKKAC